MKSPAIPITARMGARTSGMRFGLVLGLALACSLLVTELVGVAVSVCVKVRDAVATLSGCGRPVPPPFGGGIDIGGISGNCNGWRLPRAS